MIIIVAFILLQLKHFICDFLLQGPYQYLNKGTYGHLGGILHVQIHMFGSIFVLLGMTLYNGFDTVSYDLLAAVALAVEFILHYHIDWAKMNLNRVMGWTPTTTEKFWYLLGFDQLLHQLTYIWMVWFIFL